MSISWPDEIDYYVTRGTFSITPKDDNAKTDFEQGPGVNRQRFTQSITNVSFSQNFPADQWELFKEFHRVTLGKGSKWFRRRLPSSGYAGYECRFTAPYQAADFGGYSQPYTFDRQFSWWSVGQQLEVRDFDLARSETDVWVVAEFAYPEFGDEGFVDAGDLLHEFLVDLYPDTVEGTP